jgi:hypothetical protein
MEFGLNYCVLFAKQSLYFLTPKTQNLSKSSIILRMNDQPLDGGKHRLHKIKARSVQCSEHCTEQSHVKQFEVFVVIAVKLYGVMQFFLYVHDCREFEWFIWPMIRH